MNDSLLVKLLTTMEPLQQYNGKQHCNYALYNHLQGNGSRLAFKDVSSKRINVYQLNFGSN